MKKQFVLSVLLMCSFYGYSQTVSIDTCIGESTVRPSPDDLNQLFGVQSIALERKYDWSNKSVNCHINQSIFYHKEELKIYKKQLLKSGIGYVLSLTGFIVALSGHGAAGWILSGGGLAIAFGGNKKQNKKAREYETESQYHTTEVAKYIRQKGW